MRGLLSLIALPTNTPPAVSASCAHGGPARAIGEGRTLAPGCALGSTMVPAPMRAALTGTVRVSSTRWTQNRSPKTGVRSARAPSPEIRRRTRGWSASTRFVGIGSFSI